MTVLRPQEERHERRLPNSPSRTFWKAPDLSIVDEPLLVSLVKYRMKKDRSQAPLEEANLVSSITTDGRQMPVLDLDFPHTYVPSSTEGHGHLFFDVPISRFRWFALMTGLLLGKQIEMPFYVWSLRRGGNFVRIDPVKSGEAEQTKYTHGWLFKRRVK